MSDHFEQAMQSIAIHAAENGGPDVKDILVALQATNDDFDENHQQTLTMLSEHASEDKERAQRVARELAEWKANQARECKEKHRELLRLTPLRSEDSPDAGGEEVAPKGYTREQLVANFWIIVALLCLSGVVNGLIDLLFR